MTIGPQLGWLDRTTSCRISLRSTCHVSLQSRSSCWRKKNGSDSVPLWVTNWTLFFTCHPLERIRSLSPVAREASTSPASAIRRRETGASFPARPAASQNRLRQRSTQPKIRRTTTNHNAVITRFHRRSNLWEELNVFLRSRYPSSRTLPAGPIFSTTRSFYHHRGDVTLPWRLYRQYIGQLTPVGSTWTVDSHCLGRGVELPHPAGWDLNHGENQRGMAME